MRRCLGSASAATEHGRGDMRHCLGSASAATEHDRGDSRGDASTAAVKPRRLLLLKRGAGELGACSHETGLRI